MHNFYYTIFMEVIDLKFSFNKNTTWPQRGEPNSDCAEHNRRKDTPQTSLVPPVRCNRRKLTNLERIELFQKGLSPTGDIHSVEYLTRVHKDLCTTHYQMDIENVSFADADNPDTVDRNLVENTRSTNATNQTDLKDFLSRPVKILEFDWNVASGVDTILDPWDNFIGNKRVINRLNNFKLFRCKLCVKVVINGNGFYYGRMIVSYNPAYYNDQFDAYLKDENVIPESQRQKIFLDPTLSQGGVLKLPFFNPWNAVDITDTDSSTFGMLTFRTLNILRHANAGTTPVGVTVYAWAEDVELDCLTEQNSNMLTFQMDISADETKCANTSGVISGPATTIANLAGTLKSVPALSAVATPTEIAMRAGASIAKAFGYSRPNVTKCPEPYQPRACSSLANTTVPDTSCKVTLDSDQTLALGSAVAGTSQEGDPMGIVQIGKIESYVTKFTWPEGDPNSTFLFNMVVQPSICVKSASTGFGYLTPSAMVAYPFDYWTGTMNVRFQIVCSSVHKGRLKITYDPDFTSDTEDYNVAYSKVVDIADETDFTVSIKPSQKSKYMTSLQFKNDTVNSQFYSTTPYVNKLPYGNGVLTVSVVNPLTSTSVSVNDIEINVFTSMGDDFHVAAPNNEIKSLTYFEMDLERSVANPASNEEMQPNISELAEANHDTGHQPEIYFGEDIRSLRSWIKRCNVYSVINTPTGDGDSLVYRMYMDPMLRGRAPGAVSVVNGNPNNVVSFLPLTYVKNCYAGWRGSIRYKFIHEPNESTRFEDKPRSILAARTRNGPSTLYSYLNKLGRWTDINVANNALFNIDFTPSGSHLITSVVNNVMEVEMPFYSNQRFYCGRTTNLSSPTQTTAIADFLTVVVRYFDSRPGINEDKLTSYASAGEDFEVYSWLGCPPIKHKPVLD